MKKLYNVYLVRLYFLLCWWDSPDLGENEGDHFPLKDKKVLTNQNPQINALLCCIIKSANSHCFMLKNFWSSNTWYLYVYCYLGHQSQPCAPACLSGTSASGPEVASSPEPVRRFHVYSLCIPLRNTATQASHQVTAFSSCKEFGIILLLFWRWWAFEGHCSLPCCPPETWC